MSEEEQAPDTQAPEAGPEVTQGTAPEAQETQEPAATGSQQTEAEEAPDEALQGLARIPNRDRGHDRRPPKVMGVIFVAMIVLSIILASVL